MNDEALRKKVRLLKATQAIDNYYEIADLLEITEKNAFLAASSTSSCEALGRP